MITILYKFVSIVFVKEIIKSDTIIAIPRLIDIIVNKIIKYYQYFYFLI